MELTIENDILIVRKPELKGRELVANLLKDFDTNDDVEDWDFVGEEEWHYDED